MNLSKTIIQLRSEAHLTQEGFAQKLGVSRQAVQKWEAGTSTPELEHLVYMSKLFHISLDSLVLSKNRCSNAEQPNLRKIQPQYGSMLQIIEELYSAGLTTEYQQSIEEGKDISAFEDVFRTVAKLPVSDYKERLAGVLFDVVLNAPQAEGYGYEEPSELDQIKALCAGWNPALDKPDAASWEDKLQGAWLGRIAGCQVGWAVEGIRSYELQDFLKKTGNFPMHRFIYSTDVTDEIQRSYRFNFCGRPKVDQIPCAPADDDTNYMVLAAQLVEKYGRDFTPRNVMDNWVFSQCKDAYCTAERIAYKNYLNGYIPPDSAQYKNPCREWIGAQIRGDYYGYINPGDPATAAEMAWRDASISHIKNGIYGEMFVSAMIACAAVEKDVVKCIQCGLDHIPQTSRLHQQLTQVMAWYHSGKTADWVFAQIADLFDEADGHGWCHTISNAMIVVTALLYGQGDFGDSVCLAVQQGFDTDCNGATVGSVLGIRAGLTGIDPKWYAPIQGQLDTGIFGVGRVKISDMVAMTLRHSKL